MGHGGTEILVDVAPEGYTVSRAGDECFRGSLEMLQVGAGSVPWLRLDGTERVSSSASTPLADVLGEFAPSEGLVAKLEDQRQSGEFDDVVGENQAMLAETTVNGELWGWVRLEPDGRWQLLPSDFQVRAETIFRISVSQSGSMTGFVTETAVRWASPVAFTWDWDDAEGTKAMEIGYAAEDPRCLAQGCIDYVTASIVEPSCPFDEGDDGWRLSVEASDVVPDDLRGVAIRALWQPCGRHSSQVGQVLVVSDEAWLWQGDQWVRIELTDERVTTATFLG